MFIDFSLFVSNLTFCTLHSSITRKRKGKRANLHETSISSGRWKFFCWLYVCSQKVLVYKLFVLLVSSPFSNSRTATKNLESAKWKGILRDFLKAAENLMKTKKSYDERRKFFFAISSKRDREKFQGWCMMMFTRRPSTVPDDVIALALCVSCWTKMPRNLTLLLRRFGYI